MITKTELELLLRNLESDKVERTISVDKSDKFAEAICAFANDFSGSKQPGYLLIGANDDGSKNGIKVTDRLLQNLAALRSDGNIQPLPALSVEKFSFEDGDIAVVEVLPSPLPPVRYKGKVWIRVGPRKALANEHEEKILSEKRVSSALTYDALPCLEGTLTDLSFSLFTAYREKVIDKEVIEANHRDKEEQLASLRFFDLKNNCPTFGGIILFSPRVRYFLPGAYVQFLRLPGTILTDLPLDQAEIVGPLQEVFKEVELRAKVNTRVTLESVTAFQQKNVFEYPLDAIRELLLNAFVHRNYQSTVPIRLYWYEDRIELSSPGGLYGEVTERNFERQTSYRNPVLAEAMKGLGYINRYGYGIQRAKRLLQENGNPPPEFYFESSSVTVVIRKKQ